MDFQGLIGGAECGPISEPHYAKECAMQAQFRRPTLAERVEQNIQQYEAEIVKLREIEKLLSENPQIEQLINALGAANLRY
jgi:hypothetical protein